MTRCPREPLGGGQCELPAGHHGKHMRHWDNGFCFEWDDQSQAELADEWEQRQR